MDFNSNKCAIVSGATSGIGLEVVRRLDQQGICVIAIGRREERLKQIAAEAQCRIIDLAVDVGQRDALYSSLKQLPDWAHAPDYLINCAGLSLGFDEFSAAAHQDWDTMISTNITGVLNLTSFFIPQMKKRDAGHIINIGSIAAFYPYINANVYAATKAFVYNLSLNLKSELSGTRIKVTCLSPGMVKTEFALVRFKGDEEKADNFYKNYNVLSPQDVANSVMFCISQPEHVNILNMEIIPLDQPFHLGLQRKVQNA